jgi:hypothetical protein
MCAAITLVIKRLALCNRTADSHGT